MTGRMHDDGHFDATIAATYDDPLDAMNQPAAIEPAVEFLASLTGDGRALEFAIGTGRIGLPLRRRGVEVHGIELSRAMLEHLEQKAGGGAIPVTVGDMTTARADGAFRLVYLVYNTIMNVTTQAGQVAVFRNAVAHLDPAECSSSRSACPICSDCRSARPSGSSTSVTGTSASTSTTSSTRA